MMKIQKLYHILIDRFTGTPGKESPTGFAGGTIQGITDHLDYIQDLGSTGILLTPFYKGAAYHGYHVTDYDEVDPHFGTWDDVQRLVDEAHKRGMTIAADFVANHCHETHSLFADGKHKDWFLWNKDGSVRGFANLSFLPMFNTDNQEVRDFMTHHCLRLCRMGFDAIRLDHATGPTYTFWEHLRKEIHSNYPNVQLIGEVWGEMDLKPRCCLRYLWHKWRFGAQEARQMEYIGVLDGVLDFQFQSMMCAAVKQRLSPLGNKELHKQVEKHLARYPKNFALWRMLDNHDLNRFLFECGGDLKLLEEAVNYSHSLPGAYIMYYGTEKGMTNEPNKTIFDGTAYTDERVRKCVDFNKQ